MIVYNGQIDECNRAESPKIDPHTYGQLKGLRQVSGEKDGLFNQWSETIGYLYAQQRLQFYLAPYTRLDFKMDCKLKSKN